jgi:hypothetical protein
LPHPNCIFDALEPAMAVRNCWLQSEKTIRFIAEGLTVGAVSDAVADVALVVLAVTAGGLLEDRVQPVTITPTAISTATRAVNGVDRLVVTERVYRLVMG